MSQQGIKIASNKANKRTYKHLTKKEKQIIKLWESKNQAEKFLYGLYGFYSTVPRFKNNSVAWEKLDEKTLICFEESNKVIEKFNRIDNEILIKTINLFNQTQFSFSQSF
jgi:hypothetical protein